MVEKYLLSFTVWNVFKSSFDASCVELQFLTPEMSLIAFMSLITNAHAIDIGHSNQWSSTLCLRYSIYSICIRDGYEPTKTSHKWARNKPEMSQKWARNGPEMGRKWAVKNQKSPKRAQKEISYPNNI